MAIETGEVDYGPINVRDIPTFESNPDLDYAVVPSTIVNYIGFNTQAEPFTDARVRQAIAYCLDKEEMLLVSMDGYEGGTLTATPVPSTGFGCNLDLEIYPRDVEKAKELLRKPAMPMAFPLRFIRPMPFGAVISLPICRPAWRKLALRQTSK